MNTPQKECSLEASNNLHNHTQFLCFISLKD